MSVYVPTIWENNKEPAIDAANLNHIELGVESAHEEITDNADAIVLIDQKIIAIEGDGVVSTTTEPGTSQIINFVVIAQADYDALTPVATTIYAITADPLPPVI